MQTNLSYGKDDLDIITRLYRKQNTLEKAYRVTYRSAHTGKEDFVGAHDADEAEKKRREIESFGHKVQHVKVLKAKIYIKTPSEAPQNAKVQEGERGGHYYESDESSHELESSKIINNIQIINENSIEYENIKNKINNQLQLESIEPLSSKYIENLTKNNNIKNTNIVILPFHIKDAFAFVFPEENKIYLSSSSNEFINEWLNKTKIYLKECGYDDNELKNINVDNKRLGTIIHELGHLKVNKAINIEQCHTIKDVKDKEYLLFDEYVEYINKSYGNSYSDIYNKLDEMLAEDYRQLIGGDQSQIPNRYFCTGDTIHSENHVFKKERLNILRKMGVF